MVDYTKHWKPLSLLSGILVIVILFYVPILTPIIGPLFCSLVGVLTAFRINEGRREQLANERRLFFKKLLLHEIDASIKLLGSVVPLIPVDGWNSLVYSGDIALFTQRTVTQLDDAYFKVQMHNYEAKRVRDALENEILFPRFQERISADPDRTMLQQIFPRFSELKEGFDKSKNVLSSSLTELKDVPNDP